MQNLTIIPRGTTFEVHGLPPDSKMIVKIDGRPAKQLADQVLHQQDLEFANECLDAINQIPEESKTIREALWRSAVVHVMKCFGSNGARSSLPESKILRHQPAEAMLVFNYFKHLRNKYIAHDENAWAQAMTGAAINDGMKEYKVEFVLAVAALAATLDQTNWANLKNLIGASLEYTTKQFDLLTVQIKSELELVPYDELVKRDPPVYRAPEVHEISERRA